MPVRADGDGPLGRLLLDHRHRPPVEVEDGRRTEVPAGHDRVGPEVAAPLVVDVPAQRLVVGIAGEVVRRVDLDPVAVVVAEVDVEGVGHAVAAGAALDVVGEVERADGVAQAQDVVRLGHREPEVVELGPGAEREGHVVDGLLAEHPRRVQRPVRVLDRLGQPEAEVGVVGVRGGHVGDGDVDVVDAGDAGAAAQVVALDEPLDLGHLVDQLDGEAERVLGPDGLAQPRRGPGRDPPHRAAAGAVPGRGPVEVVGRAHPEADAPARGGRAAPEDQAVVDELLVPTEVERVRRPPPTRRSRAGRPRTHAPAPGR